MCGACNDGQVLDGRLPSLAMGVAQSTEAIQAAGARCVPLSSWRYWRRTTPVLAWRERMLQKNGGADGNFASAA